MRNVKCETIALIASIANAIASLANCVACNCASIAIASIVIRLVGCNGRLERSVACNCVACDCINCDCVDCVGQSERRLFAYRSVLLVATVGCNGRLERLVGTVSWNDCVDADGMLMQKIEREKTMYSSASTAVVAKI